MQIPPTSLFAEPLPRAPVVYDTPPAVVRRRRMRVLLARVRRTPAERPPLVADEPLLAPGPR